MAVFEHSKCMPVQTHKYKQKRVQFDPSTYQCSVYNIILNSKNSLNNQIAFQILL